MTATNHAVTGALIGLSIGHPIALPLALLSHFALDALPHFGREADFIKSKSFIAFLISDASLCVLLVVLLAIASPVNWLLAAICSFLATSPDFMWFPRFLRATRGLKEPKLTHPIAKFHSWIQWFQRPIGAVVELTWFASAMFLLVKTI